MMRVGFDEAFPLWMLSTPDVGGLGWENKEIGEVRRYRRASHPILLRRYWGFVTSFISSCHFFMFGTYIELGLWSTLFPVLFWSVLVSARSSTAE